MKKMIIIGAGAAGMMTAVHASKNYDVTIIEIIEEDKINNYLELDDIIIDDILGGDDKKTMM